MTARAEIDLVALKANIAAVAAVVRTPICAVVKADGYGHGFEVVAGAALEAGAQWLAVATAPEAVMVGAVVPDNTPILVLAERAPAELASVAADLPDGVRLTVCTREGIDAVASLRPGPVHLKIDTGMHRMGASLADTGELAERLTAATSLCWEGTWTHMAIADVPSDPFTDEQLDRFERALSELRSAGFDPGLTHAANSACALLHPRGRHDLVRLGIAMYGVAPSPEAGRVVELEPVLSLKAPVVAVRSIEAGETVSYGRRYMAEHRTHLATLPIGYADGVRRSSGILGVDVLIRGERCPIVGNVTMDQTMVVVPDGVRVGEECVLIGSQGDESIGADEIADRLGTIGYETLTALGPRIERRTRR